jgi:hypothetical protein
MYTNFLSNEECDLLIEYSKKHKHYNNNFIYNSVYLEEYPELPDFIKDIERRIGAATGQPPHPDEESINIHHIKQLESKRSWAANESADLGASCLRNALWSSDPAIERKRTAGDCGLAVDGVHHDKVQKEYSYATAIVYLNDVEVGGGTVWPCLSEYSNSSSDGSIAPASHCAEAFKSGARWFDGESVVRHGIYRKHRPPSEMQESLQEVLLAAHYGCLDRSEQPKWITRPAVRSIARKGSAVIFFHDQIDLTPESQVWHAGCLPISSDKWTLQKFKELPKAYRAAADEKSSKAHSKAEKQMPSSTMTMDTGEL